MLFATPAFADVLASSESAFALETKVAIAAPPTKVWDRLVDLGSWWDGTHTYSGNGANLTLDPRPGGCWCEKTPGGGVEHMRIVYVQRNETLRMTGGLGPLQASPILGVMTITLKPSGAGTEATFTYAASGYVPGGMAKLAPLVDGVLGSQWARLKAAAEAP
jgi:uncharacterized protein YndB with AHSA1/START domain